MLTDSSKTRWDIRGVLHLEGSKADLGPSMESHGELRNGFCQSHRWPFKGHLCLVMLEGKKVRKHSIKDGPQP